MILMKEILTKKIKCLSLYQKTKRIPRNRKEIV